MRQKFNLNDLSFYPDESSSRFHLSKYIEWERGPEVVSDEVFFTDLCLNLAALPRYKNRKRIALLIEPIVVNPSIYKFIELNSGLFDLILVHHKKYLNIQNSKYYFFGGSWIDDKDWKTHDKYKMLSMIASNKNFTYGHQIRHDIAKEYKESGKMDLLGSGYKPLSFKIDGLKDYRYQVVVENCKEEGYHTEKIIDCFATGTIPIYYGGDSIVDFFDKNGILSFNNLKELDIIINTVVSEEDYNNRKGAILNNFNNALSYKCAEDYIYSSYFNKFNCIL